MLMTWDDICNDQSLQNLPYKIETNRHGQIVMSPAKNWHSRRQSRINGILYRLSGSGELMVEAAIETSEGVKVADVAWASDAFFSKHADEGVLTSAPDLCVEVLSGSNTDAEITSKLALYFAHGANEVWLCDDAGMMTFHVSPTQTVPASVLFPAFPVKV